MVKKCKGNKVPHGVGGRCVNPCKKNQRRRNGKCVVFTKKDKLYNELSGRFVSKTGPTGKWMQGKGPPPAGYNKNLTYSQNLARYT